MTGIRQPRVRVVSRIYAPEPSAASQRLLSLVQGLKASGNQVAVLSSRLPSTSATPSEPHPGIARVRVLRDRSGYVRGYLPYMSFDLQAALRVLLGRRSDAILIEPPPTTGLFVGAAARWRRIPYVYYAADIWSDASAQTGAHPLVIRAVRWMEARALRRASGVLAVTTEVAERVRSLAPGAHVTVVGHGVDMDVYSPRSGDVEGTDAVDLVYVGSMSEWHGAGVLVDALARLPAGSVKAAIVGQGSEWAALRDAVRASGLEKHVRMLETVPTSEAADWLRRARVSVATLRPGAGYDFAVPTKLYSSVAVGTPVIYAGPDPVRALVNDQRLGWGVDHDARALADAIGAALADRTAAELRSHVAAWARENVSAAAVVTRSVKAIARVMPRRAD
ncbi:glycosyltransferase family 4 protein [Microbacterium sp. NPDC058342]|uniref:glycosyltransferase family 4 protein n=1 Tax=Microbacterium sp. NPDC058342 TaxID=3346454 RepID=UPI00366A3F7B